MFCCGMDSIAICRFRPHNTFLYRLKELKNPDKEKAKDRKNLKKCLKEAENDIKEGANACEVYKKKATIVRIIKSPIWEKRFADLMRKYNNHRLRFQFELTIEHAHAIDNLHEKFDGLHEKQDRVLSK